jgi:hypothetical protein
VYLVLSNRVYPAKRLHILTTDATILQNSCSAHPTVFQLITQIKSGEENRSSSLCRFHHSPLFSSGIRGSSVSIVTRLRDGRSGFDSRQGQRRDFFSSSPNNILILRPTQPSMQWVQGAFIQGVKRPGREADHSPPSNTEVKNAWSYTSSPPYVFMAWCLVKHRDNFALFLPLL